MKTESGDDPDDDGEIVLSREQRHEMVAVAAYLRAERRGFSPGREMEDWYEAAAAVDALLTSMRRLRVTRREYERVGLRNALRLWVSQGNSE